MQLQLIRNATLRLTINGQLFIIDPYFAAKYTLPAIVGKSPNPLVDLPCTPEEAIEGIEMVIVSHLHKDHFDDAAAALLPKHLPLFCPPGDEETITEKGFQQVQPILDQVNWQGITIIRTPGQHGTGVWAERMGNVSGFVFKAANEPTVYWTGDTIWYEAIEKIIANHHPDIIITHSCGAEFEANSPIIMDAEQTIAVCRAAPDAKVIAVHMDTLDHGVVSREDLRSHAREAKISESQLLIPGDGETLTF